LWNAKAARPAAAPGGRGRRARPAGAAGGRGRRAGEAGGRAKPPAHFRRSRKRRGARKNALRKGYI